MNPITYTFEYHWFHIPTNSQGTALFKAFSLEDALAKINRWNGQAPGLWQYWL